ncbi:hypothetical protein BASA50_001295 [Batrachochytrium salamandrivorans]|uniref:Uncharacterized protein n=1 Tax=Batrachochytrium salamandrivorans TaxID=1357716 RepID=A0ABQ8EWS7_9FUNG|nr:hypothetical protein BASA50_001295 [Batrachochytrium salamandrivorans]
MKLISFAVLSFLAVTVSANPPHNTDTDAMDQSPDPQEFTDADTQGAQQSQESDAQNMGQPPDDDAQNMDQPPDDDTQDVDQSSDDDTQEMDQPQDAATHSAQQPQLFRFRNTQHHHIARSKSARTYYVQLLQTELDIERSTVSFEHRNTVNWKDAEKEYDIIIQKYSH